MLIETTVFGWITEKQNVMDDEHQTELNGIQQFNNVKMSQIRHKTIYFM